METKSSLLKKFLFTYVIISFIGLGISFFSFSIFSDEVITEQITNNLNDGYTEMTSLIQSVVDGELPIINFKRNMDFLEKAFSLRIDICFTEQNIIGNSYNNQLIISNYRQKTSKNFINENITEKEISTVNINEENKEIMLLSAPLIINENKIGTIYIHTPLTNLYEHLGKNIVMFITLFLLTSAYTILAIYIISKKFTSPLIQITKVTESIAKGDFDAKTNYKGNDEISILATSINNMAKKLKENDKAQKDFIANISHELRTPLTTIQANTQGIIDGVIEKKEVQEYMKVNLEETKRLTELVNQLIELSSKDKGIDIIVTEPTNISNLITISIKQMNVKAKERKIRIVKEIEKDIIIDIDRNKMKQVIINLIDNAIKYNKESGEIKISCKQKDKKVLITIEDTGLGIPQDKISLIFERFTKFNNSKGLGIGLSICKAIIQAHNGKIKVTSEQGIGTRFEIELHTI